MKQEKINLRKAYCFEIKEILDFLDLKEDEGLNKEQVQANFELYGKNILREKKRESILEILYEQCKSVIFVLLFVAMLVSFFFNQIVEAFAILAVLLINTGIGFFTEYKAKRSMESLRKLGQKKTKVLREGETQEIPADEIVVGDILVLEAGDMVTADARIIDSSNLSIDESTLTGESNPVSKNPSILNSEVDLAERDNMLFKGTSLHNGSVKAIVTAVGMNTELGNISSLTENAKEGQTPLEDKLDKLGAKLVYLTIFVTIIVIVSGLGSGKDLIAMVKTGIALAIAAIPEGLPIVATIALAKGMWLMAENNALVNKLSSVETLGAVTSICTDKTGTLTENIMTVKEINLSHRSFKVSANKKLEEDKPLNFILEIAVLCNNASLDYGDPMEKALLQVSAKKDIRKENLEEKYPRIKEEAFDSDRKMMGTYHESDKNILVAVKGAAESVLNVSTKWLDDHQEQDLSIEKKEFFLHKSKAMASEGFRVLAFAYKYTHDKSDEAYSNLVFLGLIGFFDPPRNGVKEAISSCKDAGVKVIMVTGDQKETAENIAREVNLVSENDFISLTGKTLNDKNSIEEAEKVFYRVNPEQKLNLIKLLQDSNEIVAMTGDGVNDAPALKKADIGIAMGKRGTQVAKDVADMILEDDHFSTIVKAIQQGRVIFANIRRFVVFLLSCNISEILIVLFASLINAPLPILPLQILYLNLITDVFPALALGLGEGGKEYLEEKPRDPKEAILKNSHWFFISIFSLVITFSTLSVFYIGLYVKEFSEAKAITMSFLTLGFAQVLHVFNMRYQKSPIFINDITKNNYIWYSIILCAILLLAAVYIPVLKEVLELSLLSLQDWGLIMTFSFLPLIFGQALIHFKITSLDK